MIRETIPVVYNKSYSISSTDLISVYLLNMYGLFQLHHDKTPVAHSMNRNPTELSSSQSQQGGIRYASPLICILTLQSNRLIPCFGFSSVISLFSDPPKITSFTNLLLAFLRCFYPLNYPSSS